MTEMGHAGAAGVFGGGVGYGHVLFAERDVVLGGIVLGAGLVGAVRCWRRTSSSSVCLVVIIDGGCSRGAMVAVGFYSSRWV